MKILMLLLVLLCSCDLSEATKYAAKEVAPHMVFIKHQPSGLCFAFIVFDRSASFTEVPCDKVKDLLAPSVEKNCK